MPDTPETTNYQSQCLDLIRGILATHPTLAWWIKPSYVMASIETECSWNPRVSTDGLGSLGPMQVLPATALGLGITASQADTPTSILTGMLYLNSCLTTLYSGSKDPIPLREVIEAYNEGPGNVEKGRQDPDYWQKWSDSQRKWAFVDNPVPTAKPLQPGPPVPATTGPLPSLGRIVLYCDPHMGDECPGIITLVNGADMGVSLTSFPVGASPNPVMGNTPFNPTDKPVKGQWRWPPQTGK